MLSPVSEISGVSSGRRRGISGVRDCRFGRSGVGWQEGMGVERREDEMTSYLKRSAKAFWEDGNFEEERSVFRNWEYLLVSMLKKTVAKSDLGRN